MTQEIKTPFLWFTQLIDGDPKPWRHFKIEGVMVNAYEIFRKKRDNIVMDKGIHNYLNFKGLITIDSGGFLFMKKKIQEIHPNMILELYERSKPNFGVVLDYPIQPRLPKGEREKRQRKTLENTKYMVTFQKSKNPILIPVVHGYSLRNVAWFIKELDKIYDFKIYGIGSLVPSVFNTKGAGGIYNVVKIVSFIRKMLPDKKLHVFGIGSTLTMHLMFYIGADFVDSSGWRTKAAFGAIQLPGTADRYITRRRKHKNYPKLNKEERKLLENCNCPVCRNHSINDLMQNFQLRALHNAWVFQHEVKIARELIKEDIYDKYVEKILHETPFHRVLEYAKKLKNKQNIC
jgi:tRNA-guanine family transglycosylase